MILIGPDGPKSSIVQGTFKATRRCTRFLPLGGRQRYFTILQGSEVARKPDFRPTVLR